MQLDGLRLLTERAWVVLDDDGAPLGFYTTTTFPLVDGEANPDIPAEAVELPLEAYETLVADAFYRWRDGELVYVEPPPVIEPMPRLTRRQFRLMLVLINLPEAAVQREIETIDDPTARQMALIEYQDATHYERDHWLVDEVAEALGFSGVEMDTMWRYAGTL